MTTDFLWDDGEGSWEHRLHVGCGTVYLDGYLNADIRGTLIECPEDAGENRTSILCYYNNDATLENLPERESFVDSRMDMCNTGLAVGSVDKLVCIQALEHLSRRDVSTALQHWWNILKPGAPLIISVPDSDETLARLLSDRDRKETVRLLRGSLKNDVSAHLTWFTPETLVKVLKDHGFEDVKFLPNFHLYPAVVVKAHKRDLYMAGREYQEGRIGIPDGATTILDIGPGNFPFARATHYLDRRERRELETIGEVFDLDDIPQKALPYKTGQFDFAYCSHVLEHVASPMSVVKELMRVSRAGYIEVPHFVQDFMFQFGKTHSLWNCTWGASGELVMTRRQEIDKSMFLDASGFGRRLFIDTHSLDATLTAEQVTIRNFYWSCMHRLNISTGWNQAEGILPQMHVFDRS